MENKIINSILKAENQAEEMLEKEKKSGEALIEKTQKKAEEIKKEFYASNKQFFLDKSRELEEKFSKLYKQRLLEINLQAKQIEDKSKKQFEKIVDLLKQSI